MRQLESVGDDKPLLPALRDLILSEVRLEELELVTFDKKLSRMQHCQLLVTELQ